MINLAFAKMTINDIAQGRIFFASIPTCDALAETFKISCVNLILLRISMVNTKCLEEGLINAEIDLRKSLLQDSNVEQFVHVLFVEDFFLFFCHLNLLLFSFINMYPTQKPHQLSCITWICMLEFYRLKFLKRQSNSLFIYFIGQHVDK